MECIRGGKLKTKSYTPNKKAAIKTGKSIAQNQHSELIIHGLDGKTQNRNTYGSDPYPPRG